jgi:hypothetical protein
VIDYTSLCGATTIGRAGENPVGADNRRVF